jgi:hypothetical protein
MPGGTVMTQFDPNIPGLMEGEVTSLAVIDPQPFVGGTGNHVIDPSKEFTVKVELEVHGQLAPLWLDALGGEWDFSVYAESLGGGNEVRLGTENVPVTATLPCTVNQAKANCTKYEATVVVPANTLQEHIPGTDQGGIYKLVAAVFLNSTIAGIPGYDVMAISEGPVIAAENPE